MAIVGLFISFLINTGLLWLISHIFHWVSFASLSSLIITGVFITIFSFFLTLLLGFNVIIRIPLEILGLWMAGKVISGFHIAGFWQLIATYIVIAVISYIIYLPVISSAR